MDLAVSNVANLYSFVRKLVCVYVHVCMCVVTDTLVNVTNFFFNGKQTKKLKSFSREGRLLLSHFLPFKVHLTNTLRILMKMVNFKNFVLPLRQVEN